MHTLAFFLRLPESPLANHITHFLSHITENCEFIHRIHKWRAINYSFIYVLIRPTSLVVKEYLFCILPVLTILVALISSKLKQKNILLVAIYASGV